VLEHADGLSRTQICGRGAPEEGIHWESMLATGVIDAEGIHDILDADSSVIVGSSVDGVFNVRARLCTTTKAITRRWIVRGSARKRWSDRRLLQTYSLRCVKPLVAGNERSGFGLSLIFCLLLYIMPKTMDHHS
jgi:hypothetical protein